MYDYSKLQWIDLAHNHIIQIDLDFSLLVDLKSLYLHCNYIKDMNEMCHLNKNQLRSLTIHGNPIENIPNFRLYIISILPTLKKIDTVLISRKEIDDSHVFLVKFNNQYKTYPYIQHEGPPEDELDNSDSNK